ncbi:hypothetical protein BDZ94DRAFT_1231393 [Collybia nuda]|uniref:Radical SAM core domain-containing protein n=1 Tax=Collybia nuda TaxID=64659 RepID=A0A9P5YJC8_9AGAR|nr:hypothetical protein BDZ94DRAFT_1231393 [Collybia nuda]
MLRHFKLTQSLRPNPVLSKRCLSTPTSLHPRTSAKSKIAEIDAHSLGPFPFSPALVDSFNRHHDYLRISLTERCNLRCFYCMPSEGVDLSPDGHILTNDEVIRLATLFVKSGVTKIRLTGGEPTVRKGIDDIIGIALFLRGNYNNHPSPLGRINELRKYGLKSIAMTSNGISLHRRLPHLVENGLTHLNLSLDTLDPFKFELITRRRGHEAVVKALDVALASSLKSVKLNVVVIKGLNDAEVFDFVEMTKDKPLSVRFIEFMPFTGNKWDKKKMVPSSELLERLSVRYPDVHRAPEELNETARTWQIPGYQGSFGFISSMSDHFCATCNRLRITADGQIKVCLFDAKEVSLRDELRRGASDAELLEIIGAAVYGKHAKHAGMENIDIMCLSIAPGPNKPGSLVDIANREYSSESYVPRIMQGRRSWPLLSGFPGAGSTIVHGVHHFSTSSSHGPTSTLTHIDSHGNASMVDVGDKQPTRRTATAVGRIYIPRIAYELVTATYPLKADDGRPKTPQDNAQQKARKKGDALTVAQLAAIMGSKKTSDLIPLCHPLAISKVAVDLIPENYNSGRYSIMCRATVSTEGKTGVEMEALTAVSVGLLTVWDMLKAVAGREMEIGEIYVSDKSGGRSGDFHRDHKERTQ